MLKERISGRFLFKRVPGKVFAADDPLAISKTQQHFAEDVDVNNIIARFVRTGMLGDPVAMASRQASFGDFSSGEDFHAVMNKVTKAQASFGSLPADIRNKFNNDPALLIDFISKEENLKEAVDLGLLPKSLYDQKLAIEGAAAKAAAEAAKAASEAPKPV